MNENESTRDLFSLKNNDLIFDDLYRFRAIIDESRFYIRARAEDTEINRLRTLRFIAPGLIKSNNDFERLKAAAQKATRLTHPSFIIPKKLEDTNGLTAIIEEWIESASLLDIIRQAGAFSETATVQTLVKLADALDELPEGFAKFRFSLADIHIEVSRREQRQELLTNEFKDWPDWKLRLSPISLENLFGAEADSEREQFALKDSFCRMIFHMLTGSMGDPMSEPVISEEFTSRLRGFINRNYSANSCKSILWDLFRSSDPQTLKLIRPEQAENEYHVQLFEAIEKIDAQIKSVEENPYSKSDTELAHFQQQRKQLLDHHQRVEEQKEQLSNLERQLTALSSDLTLQQELRKQQSKLVGEIDQAENHLQASLDSYREEASSLRQQVGGYKRLLKIAAPITLLTIMGFAIAFITKPSVPDQPSEIMNWPKWKQQRLRSSIINKIENQAAQQQWRESLGLLNIYIAAYNDKPPSLQKIANDASSTILDEYEKDQQAFKDYYLDEDSKKVSLDEPLERISTWGISPAGRLYRELRSRKILEQGLRNQSIADVTAALRLLLETRKYFPSDTFWNEQNTQPLASGLNFMVSNVNEILRNWPESKESAQKFVNEIQSVSEYTETNEFLEILSKNEFENATYLLIVSKALEQLQKDNFADSTAVLSLLKGFREQLPIERQRDLTEHLTNLIKTLRNQYQRSDKTFIQQLETYRKPKIIREVAHVLATSLALDTGIELGSPEFPDHPEPDILSLDWFSRMQLRELYMFVADILTQHHIESPTLHPAYQYAANMGDPEGMHWAGRGILNYSMANDKIAIPSSFEKGISLLEESIRSENSDVAYESLIILTEVSRTLKNAKEELRYATHLREINPTAQAQRFYLEALENKAKETRSAQDIDTLALTALTIIKTYSDFPKAEQQPLLWKALSSLKLSFSNLKKDPSEMKVYLQKFFQLENTKQEDPTLGLSHYYRALWRSEGLSPFENEQQNLHAIFTDIFEGARLGFAPAQQLAKDNGINWHMKKKAAIQQAVDAFK